MPCPYFGNLPAEYNRAVHGNYYPHRYYGKADTPLGEVKVSELTAWLNRRNVNPVAIFQAFMRGVYKHSHRFINPRYSFPGVGYNQKIVCLCLFFYLINWKTIRHHKQFKYHW